MKCLVTGATGFLGTNLVHQLVRQGHTVRASGMHGSDTKHIEELPIEIAFADITNPEELDPIISGCDVVFHVAGDTSFWRRYYKRQQKINVEGTINIAEACLRHGVKRMVYTSTIDVLGYNPTGGSFDEESGRFNYDNMGYHYGETKQEAEIRLKAYNSDSLEIVTIYPGFMLGPFDHTLQIGRTFFDLAKKKLPGFPPGGGSFCDVTEVAKAHIVAAIKGRPGEGYICAGMPHTNLKYSDMFRRMAAALNVPPPTFTIPKSLFVFFGYISELIAEVIRKPPEMNPGMARYLSSPQYAISGKAIRELDYRVPEVENFINDAINWYRSQGYVL